MPTFFATTTKIHLSVSDLAASTTKILSTHASSATARKLQASVAEISSGEVLTEQPLCCQDGSHLRFLGEHEDMPFFMVQAGKNLFKTEVTESILRRQAVKPVVPLSRRAVSHASNDSDSTLTTIGTMTTANDGDAHVEKEQGDTRFKKTNGSSIPAKRSSSGRNLRQPSSPPVGRSSRASSVVTKTDNNTPDVSTSRFQSPNLARQSLPSNGPIPLALTQPEVVPRALSLTVILSKESFAQSCRIGTKHVAQDVKIDIFLNGEMTASTYVPARYRGEANNFVQLTQRFSGRRVGRMLERPWVFVPPGQNADGTLRTSKRNKTAYVDAHERWKAIARSLNNEAEAYGKNQRSDKSVIGEYLVSLAKLDMPTEVDDMQKGGGPKLGVIDVILTLGRGQKDQPEGGYVKEPTRMRLLGFHHDGTGKERRKATNGASAKPLKENAESTIPDPSTSTGNYFSTPIAPSSATSAFRGGRSLATTGATLRSGSHAKSSQKSSMSTTIDKSLSAEQPKSSPMPKSSSLGGNLSLVPAGSPMPKFNAKLPVGLHRPLLDSQAFSGPSSLISRARANNGAHTRKSGALGDMNPAETSHARRSSLRQNYSLSPSISGMRISSDISTVSSDQSSPSTVSKRQERKGAAVTSGDNSPSSTRMSKDTLLRRTSDDMGVSPDVVAAIRGTLSDANRFRQRARSRPTTKPTPKIPQKRYKGFISTDVEAPQARRTSSSHRWGVSDRLTLAEEMAQIEASSRKENSSAAGISARSHQDSDDSNTLYNEERSDSPQKIVKLKLKGSLLPQMTPPSSFTSAEMAVGNNRSYPAQRRSRSMSNRAIHNNTSKPPTVEPAPTPTPKPQPKARQKPPAATPLTTQGQPNWPTPALSQDSVLTYAEEPSWKTGPHSDRKHGAAGRNGGVFRQIKAERNGWFEESSILMGVRFLVG